MIHRLPKMEKCPAAGTNRLIHGGKAVMDSLSNMSSGWLFITMITGVVGTAFAIYGIRRKRPVPLIFGFLFGSYTLLISNVWLCLLVGILLIGGFVVVQKQVN
jgi:hypothetical protein